MNNKNKENEVLEEIGPEDLLDDVDLMLAKQIGLPNDIEEEEVLEDLSKQEEYEFVCNKCFTIKNNALKDPVDTDICRDCK
jgi:hypothetical protein